MKYLVQNRKECTMTIVALVVAILDFLKVFFGVDFGIADEQVLAVVSSIMGVLVWYYNMPTSLENCEATGEMRARKAERKGKCEGEKFYSDEDEE